MNNFSLLDAPIRDDQEDILNRKEFCHKITNSIRNWKGNTSLVLAICGDWGSGKTSIKNLIVHYLKDDIDKEKIIYLDFNPWHWSKTDEIHLAFFRELDKKINNSTIFGSDKELRRLSNYISSLSHGDFADDIVKLSPIAAALISGGLATIILLTTKVFIMYVIVFIMIVATYLLAIKGIRIIYTRKKNIFLSKRELTIEDAKLELRNHMMNLNIKIVISIDDIDRLSSDEIKRVFQILKVHADFPNLVYLCLFQKSVIENVITKDFYHSKLDYMDKIFQVTLDIPQPTRKHIDDYFIKMVLQTFSEIEHKPTIHEEDLYIVYKDGLKSYFSNLRAIKRYLNSLKFHASCFVSNNELEVNPLDLIILEVLRLFETDVYTTLYHNQGKFGKESRYTFLLDKEMKIVFEEIIKKSKDSKVVSSLLTYLFPKYANLISEAYGNNLYIPPLLISKGDGFDMLKTYRLSHPEVFERYFTIDFTAEDIRRDEVLDFIEKSSDETVLKDKIVDLIREERIFIMIKYITAHSDEINYTNIPLLISTMIKVAKLINWRFYNDITGQMSILLQRKISKGDRTLGEHCFDNVMSILDYDIYARTRLLQGLIESSNRKYLGENYIRELLSKASNDIDANTKDTDFLDKRTASYILYFWGSFSNPQLARKKFKEFLSSRDTARKIMKRFLSYGETTQDGMILASVSSYMDNLSTRDEVYKSWEELDVTDATPEEISLLEVFEKGESKVPEEIIG